LTLRFVERERGREGRRSGKRRDSGEEERG
jgi:hypothetical protein